MNTQTLPLTHLRIMFHITARRWPWRFRGAISLAFHSPYIGSFDNHFITLPTPKTTIIILLPLSSFCPFRLFRIARDIQISFLLLTLLSVS